jgi:hypothetical protein
MERTLISWNIANWITIMLMGAAGYVVLALVSQAFKSGSLNPAPNTAY